MKISFIKQKFVNNVALLALFSSIFLITACDNSSSKVDNQTKKEISMGVSPGPYNDLFKDAVKPILEAEGYKVKLVNFPHLLESDVALSEGSIDLTVAQHTAYMDVFNSQRKANLKPVVHVPSVPAAIFSNKYTSIKNVFSGAKIGIPQDASNAARSYNLLEKAGWIKLKPNTNPIIVSKNDIAENIAGVDIVEMDSANIPRVLNELDFAVIPGSIVYSANIDSKKALLSETIIPDLEIMVVVNGGNENSQWAKDIKRIYQSQQFKDYMQTHNQNGYWVMPQE
ncbi:MULTISPECIES: MetQ/NlpA family ABC transporter substrate-binding protein [Gilliamella]|uniref:MetQ/NlpA family ABC transporter substrate-binding protein n=1 Tax=Gilliamella TaxID=1193503 RepID=UPI0009BFC4E0|nr:MULTISPECIES: MetQ/NlpA family ABC transporter substrate-binding protein [Gilliamella]MBI0060663.1 metal ABC transporter substrate-binding protein [Gilliamella sp. M0320]MBI0153665.1 metal ABC transporter substrate-binding protein [Gilliamella sp. W8128]MCT6884985.1 MetQ/NlpA family ABC transporter substrate-binding protein [Gilliamella apis]OTQ36782.1 metal ABC transporter substrate-binding protein [Gilliamella apis]OTQ38733.1 metal ABC transporter substrate-binding protein [Gilliamella ap